MMHLHTCLKTVAVVVALFALPSRGLAAGCPTVAYFEPTGSAVVDAGWTGIEHAMPLLGSRLPLALSCPSSTPPCGMCTITGVAPILPLRCTKDTARTCTVATEVADCGEPDSCRVPLSPPQSIGAGGIPLCVTNDISGPVGGTLDADTGAFAPIVPVQVRVFSGVAGPPFPGGGQIQGCPRCVGDPFPNDGNPGGTCDAGPRDGLACDTNATSELADFGSASFDCPPDPATNAVVAVVNVGAIAASTGTVTRTLSADSPKCLGQPGTPCFCSTCNTAVGEPCSSNVDCPLSGGNPGICGGRRCVAGGNAGAPCGTTSECPGGICGQTGEPQKPDACLDDTMGGDACIVLGDGGTCPFGPVMTVCSNHPDRGCVTDAACDAVPGACTAINRRCYGDNGALGASISVSGTATPPTGGLADPTDLVTLACLPPSGSSTLNNLGGFPGLLRSTQPGRLHVSDGPIPTPTTTSGPTATPTPLPGVCPAAPALCRSPIQAGKASLQLTDRSPDDKDKLQWKWMKGAATSLADLGDPIGSDEYALCLYDVFGLRATLQIPPGGTCQGNPCWRQKSSGFLYKNKDAGPHGITQLTLKAGADGKAQAQVKGQGSLLPLPSIDDLTGTMEVQLRNNASGLCWGTTFVPPFDKRTDEILKDKAD